MALKITLERAKHILGLPSILVIATILFANAFMQLLSDLFDDSILLESILVAVLAAVVATCLMKTLATLHSNVSQITNQIGQPGTLRMKNRKGLILICGLSSAETSSAAMKVLQVGESLEFVALIGTKETNGRGVETFIEKRY